MSVRRRAAGFGAFLLAKPVARYIGSQRDRLAKTGVPLAPDLKREFTPYFKAELLDHVRIVASDDLRIPAAPFEALLRRLRISVPSAGLAFGITFDTIVAVRGAPDACLLFHELVHVAQYRLLGISKFARLYVRGFLAEGSYDRIPLELCAWALHERFARREAPFSVEAVVSAWIERDLL